MTIELKNAESYKTLIDKAITVLSNSYAPYSNIHVAAALETANGKVYLGVNVENSSYGLTICAERSAVCNAVTYGEKEFKRIAIVTDMDEPIPPCGACCQVLAEFNPDIEIIMYSIKSRKIVVARLSDIFIKPFKLRNNK